MGNGSGVLGVLCLLRSWKQGRKLGSCQSLAKSWPFGAEGHRDVVWLPGPGAGVSGLPSCRSDLQQDPHPGTPTLVTAGRGPEFVWSLRVRARPPRPGGLAGAGQRESWALGQRPPHARAIPPGVSTSAARRARARAPPPRASPRARAPLSGATRPAHARPAPQRGGLLPPRARAARAARTPCPAHAQAPRPMGDAAAYLPGVRRGASVSRGPGLSPPRVLGPRRCSGGRASPRRARVLPDPDPRSGPSAAAPSLRRHVAERDPRAAGGEPAGLLGRAALQPRLERERRPRLGLSL